MLPDTADSYLPVHPDMPSEALWGYVDAYATLRDYENSTKTALMRTVKDYLEYHERTAQDVLAWKKDLDSRLSRATVVKRVSLLRGFLEFLVAHNAMPYNPLRMVRVKGPKPESRPSLSVSQAKDYLKRAHSFPRTYCAACILLYTSVRVTTALNIRLDDLEAPADDLPGKIRVRHKGRVVKDASVYIFPPLWNAISRWLKVRPSNVSEYLLCSYYKGVGSKQKPLGYSQLYQDLKRVADAASIKSFTPHMLRHTAITIARGSGASLEDVRAMAGHADPRTTMIYDHSIRRAERAPEKLIASALA